MWWSVKALMMMYDVVSEVCACVVLGGVNVYNGGDVLCGLEGVWCV